MIVKIYSVFCDGTTERTEMIKSPDCHGWIGQEKSLGAARRLARKAGWFTDAYEDKCPACLAAA